MTTAALRRHLPDAVSVAALIVLSVTYARLSFDRAIVYPDFAYLSPAIAVASGRGFLDPAAEPGSPLHAFLTSQSPTLASEQVSAPAWQNPDQSKHASRYLIYAVGLTWSALGISWAALGWVSGALLALLVVGAYALFRFFMPIAPCAIGAAWLAVSTVNLKLIPHVRDFSKGAFIVALLPLIVGLAVAPTRRTTILALAAATGVFAGIGAGFKMDVSVAVPLGVLAIVLFRERRPWLGLPLKALASAVLIAGYLLASAPVFLQLSGEGSNAIHVLLLGWAAPFDVALGVQRSLYSIMPYYSDTYATNLIKVHGMETTGVVPAFTSREYDAASASLWLDIARTFPGDVATRIVASANGSLNQLFRNPEPTFVSSPLPGESWTAAIAAWLGRFDGTGAIFALGFLGVLAGRSVKYSLVALFILLSAGGYAFLQYAERHYFHLQVLSVGVVLGLICGLATLAAQAFRHGWSAAVSALRPASLTGVIAVASVGGSLLVLQGIQESMLAEELRRVVRYSPTRMATVVSDEPDGSATIRWPAPVDPAPVPMRWRYYLAEFRVEQPQPLLVGVRYDGADIQADFSRVLAITAVPGANFIGIPVLSEHDRTAFDGLEVGPLARRAFVGVYQVTSGPAGLPLDLLLPANWRDYALHQRLYTGAVSAPAAPSIVCGERSACVGVIGRLEQRAALRPAAASIDAVHSPIVKTTGAQVTVDGLAETESSYLFQLKSHPAAAGDAFVAHGTMFDGRVVIGLLKAGRWYKQIVVSQPGDFSIAMTIDEPGEFTPLVTNAMASGRRYNHLTLAEAGFLPAH